MKVIRSLISFLMCRMLVGRPWVVFPMPGLPFWSASKILNIFMGSSDMDQPRHRHWKRMFKTRFKIEVEVPQEVQKKREKRERVSKQARHAQHTRTLT